MNHKKIVFSFLMVLSFSTFLPLPCEPIYASAYDDCDVNHDGTTNVLDAVELLRYLGGTLYTSDYLRYDTNKSLTVDEADAKKIISKLAGISYTAKYWDKDNNCTVSFPTVSGFTPDPDASSTTSRTYMKYSYVTNQSLGTYTLTPLSDEYNSDPSSPTPRGIIGYDDRQPSVGSENTGIVRLFGGTNANSTVGFIVGDHVIATAAHCVYSHSEHAFKSQPVIRPYSANGHMIVTDSFTPIEVHIPSNYDSTGGSDLYDYALITVSDDLSDYTHFSLGTTYNLTPTDYSTIPLYLLGPRVERYYTNQLYYSQGNVVSPTTGSSNLIYYDCDSLQGESGSPVYTITKVTMNNQISYFYSVLAIHIRNDSNVNLTPTWNAGNRITKYHLQFFNENANSNISY